MSHAGRPYLTLSPRLFKSLLALHIMFSVGLLGDSAGYLAVVIYGTIAADPAIAGASFHILRMLAFVFGIPLSLRSPDNGGPYWSLHEMGSVPLHMGNDETPFDRVRHSCGSARP